MAHTNTSGAIARITREIANAQKGDDLSISVACCDADVRHVRALIIGPPSSPYEFGFFEFECTFPREYPIKSPSVRCITTNGGRTRFNPNIYAEGKVCLSILGTWRGQPGEEWSSAQGLESVLLSIQSLMSSNPYENEPGYETAKKDEPNPSAYIAKIRHEALRVSVIQRLEGLLSIHPDRSEPPSKRLRRSSSSDSHGELTNPDPNESNVDSNAYEYDAEATFNALNLHKSDPFADLIKRRFLWYYDAYKRSISTHSGEQNDGTAFTRMEFEYPPNSMEGSFDYKGLHARLEQIRRSLDQETSLWEQEGAEQVAEGTQIAHQLDFQYKQQKYRWNETQYAGPKVELSLPDSKNPFVWHLTLFGEPMTNLDGGIFNMKFYIPPNFPEAQPRLTKEDEIASHIEAIVVAIADKDDPKYDPRAMVNPEVFELYWGDEKKRKEYNRKLRRSAQESSMNLDPRTAASQHQWLLLTLLQRLKMLDT